MFGILVPMAELVLLIMLKFGPSEKGTRFEKIFDLKFDAT